MQQTSEKFAHMHMHKHVRLNGIIPMVILSVGNII